jgi:hypothetical protein
MRADTAAQLFKGDTLHQRLAWETVTAHPLSSVTKVPAGRAVGPLK